MENLIKKYDLSLRVGYAIKNLEKSGRVILLEELHLPNPKTLWPELQMALGTFNDKLLSMYVLSPTQKPTPLKGLRKMLTPVIFNTKDEFEDMLKEEFDRNLSNLDYEKRNCEEFTDCYNPFFRSSNDIVYGSRDKKQLSVIRLKKYNEKKDVEITNIFLNYYKFF